MGVDLHFHVERREREQAGAPWVSLDTWTEEEVGGRTRPRVEHPYFATRDDVFFGLFDPALVGPGVEALVPIGPARGLPTDADARILEAADDPRAFGATWCTVAELDEYDWSREFLLHGRMPAADFAKFRGEQFSRLSSRWEDPHVSPLRLELSWERVDPARAAGDPNCLSRFEADEVLARCDERPFEECCPTEFVCAAWTTSVGEHCPDWMIFHLPLLRSLGRAEDVRVVLWFTR